MYMMHESGDTPILAMVRTARSVSAMCADGNIVVRLSGARLLLLALLPLLLLLAVCAGLPSSVPASVTTSTVLDAESTTTAMGASPGWR